MKNEITRVLQITDKAKEEFQVAKKEKKFIDKQYKELVEKQNKKYVVSEAFCPKCSATKQCLTEIMEETTKLKKDNVNLEKENKLVRSLSQRASGILLLISISDFR